MKPLFVFCAACCFIALLKLPIGYYTFLRIVVSLGSLVAIYNFQRVKNHSWLIIFAIILILFNPLFPIYLHKKSIWMSLDVIVGVLFLLLALFMKAKPIAEEKIEPLIQRKTYTRDRIIISKNTTLKDN